MTPRSIALLMLASASVAFGSATDRRLYTFHCFEERGGTQRTLYAADVEGPSDVDFQIVMHDARHDIEATFVNEPLPAGGIDSRVHLRSRRAWGLSKNNLPLWEEDDQHLRIQIEPGQQIELLPFGRSGEAGLLKLEITPSVPRPAVSARPLEIRIGQQAPGGAINVLAYRSPHWYTAEVALSRNGVATAHGSRRLFVDEGGLIALRGASSANATEVRITPSVVPNASRWELVSIRIDASFARGWTAVALADKPITLPIDDQQTLVITLHPEGDAP
jgi:hypothetical protein